jgi:hypothetical protein
MKQSAMMRSGTTLPSDGSRRGLWLCWMVLACAGVSGCCRQFDHNQFDHIVTGVALDFWELDRGRLMDACDTDADSTPRPSSPPPPRRCPS